MKALWPEFQKDKVLARYFPDNFADSKGPSRKYFFDVLNTVYPDYLEKIMAHANEMRWTSAAPDKQKESIHISQKWEDELKAMPFLSCKFQHIYWTQLLFHLL